MNFNPNPDNTAWAHVDSTTTLSKAKADIVYDIGRPDHRNGILEVLARAFVRGPSAAHQLTGRPGFDELASGLTYFP
jgi:hypothetical protein